MTRNVQKTLGLLRIALLASVALLFIFRPTRTQQEKSIPFEALSKIRQEKAKAQKEFGEFVQTPAGKIWEKHPYWDPATCQKIAEGKVEPGMSKEQVSARTMIPLPGIDMFLAEK